MDAPFEAAPEITVFPSYEPFPQRGWVPVNAYLVRGSEPLLVDSGGATDETRFLAELFDRIEPDDLCWIFLTHEGWEHSGNVAAIMDEAPRAKLITSYLTLHSMGAEWHVEPDRVYVVNPMQRILLGGRGYLVVRPPVFSSPATLGLYNEAGRTLFSSDAFGMFVTEKARSAQSIGESELIAGLQHFALMTSPWLHLADQKKFARGIEIVRRALRPFVILSAHAPVLRGMVDLACDALLRLPRRDPLAAPDDAAYRAPRYAGRVP